MNFCELEGRSCNSTGAVDHSRLLRSVILDGFLDSIDLSLYLRKDYAPMGAT